MVALETAVVTHGLPRERRPGIPDHATIEGFDRTRPVNLAASLMQANAVRAAGAVPAVLAVLHGEIRVGLEERELTELAADPAAAKLSARDLAAACESGGSGGTTVAASLVIARGAGIRLFATGGIGGVHRGWSTSLDISADLQELRSSAVLVVASGAKNILDLPATLEALESLSIPVLGWRDRAFPRFLCAATASLQCSAVVQTASKAAAIARRHWALGGGGILLANGISPELALPEKDLEAVISAAPSTTGPMATPALLSRLSGAAGGDRMLVANLAILADNARLAANCAGVLAST